MKNQFGIFVFSMAIIISTIILANTYTNRNRTNDIINVTGLGSKDFKSDLIVWSGSFQRKNRELTKAYEALKLDKEKIRKYLLSKGVSDEIIIFSSVDIIKEYEYTVNEKGNSSAHFAGYRLTQNVEIESQEIEKIEEVSREITELINLGVEFQSQSPQYYYTKLSELKIEMIATATENARIRAEQIATNAGSEIGDLRYAQMGIFQIIGQNSNEDYSWGGTFNTSSKMKTATITMKLQFGIDNVRQKTSV